MLRKFNDGQEMIFEDLNAIPKAVYRSIYDNLVYELGQRKASVFFGDSLKVEYINNSTVMVRKGMAFALEPLQVNPENKYRPIIVENDESIVLPPPHATLPRFDLIVVKSEIVPDLTGVRKYKSASSSTVANQNFTLQEKFSANILVVEGGADSLPPAVPSGFVKIAEVYVEPVTGLTSQSGIVDKRSLFPVGADMALNTIGFTRLTNGSAITISQLMYEIDLLLRTGKNEYLDITSLNAIDPEPAPPSFGYERIFYKDGVMYVKHNSGLKEPLGSGGGGGGSGAEWLPSRENGAEPDYESGLKVFKFENGADQEIEMTYRVPSGYIAGRQVNMSMLEYSLNTSGNVKFELTCTLFKKGVTAINDASNQNVSAHEIVSTDAYKNHEFSFNITSSTGTINTVPIAAGDFIKMKLKRVAASVMDDTETVRLIPNTTEIGVV